MEDFFPFVVHRCIRMAFSRSVYLACGSGPSWTRLPHAAGNGDARPAVGRARFHHALLQNLAGVGRAVRGQVLRPGGGHAVMLHINTHKKVTRCTEAPFQPKPEGLFGAVDQGGVR